MLICLSVSVHQLKCSQPIYGTQPYRTTPTGCGDFVLMDLQQWYQHEQDPCRPKQTKVQQRTILVSDTESLIDSEDYWFGRLTVLQTPGNLLSLPSKSCNCRLVQPWDAQALCWHGECFIKFPFSQLLTFHGLNWFQRLLCLSWFILVSACTFLHIRLNIISLINVLLT